MDWINPCGGMLMMIAWGLLLITGIVALVRWIFVSGISNNPSNGENSALKVLLNRYAAGEITKEEFEEVKKNITE